MFRTTIWILPWSPSYTWGLTEKEVSVWVTSVKPFPIVVETTVPVRKFMFDNWSVLLKCVPLEYYPVLLPYLSACPNKSARGLYEAAYEYFTNRTA
jgi:hypothetical protein